MSSASSMPSARFSPKPFVLLPFLALMLVVVAVAPNAHAQAIAETAGATSVSAGVTSAIKPVMVPSLPAATASTSQHLIATNAPPVQETNIREFQSKAGKDAGKMLLRATPAASQIWVNGKIVGKTPLLLVLAPGKYEVEMRGARGETGKSIVDLLPRETREVQLKLQSLYPARVKSLQQ